jgi:energy-coupling factor transporter ATP-binding protein EcfA2
MSDLKIVVIMGPPGCGKTTLMKQFLHETGPYEADDSVKLVPFLKRGSNYILGKYDGEGYAQGTDRMSMACQPAVIEWLKTLPSGSTLFLEGDRLANQSFLEHCAEKYALKVIYLHTTADERNARYKARGSEQSEQFVRGRETKYNNLLTNFTLMEFIDERSNMTPEDAALTLNLLVGETK